MWISLVGAESPGHSFPNASCHLECFKNKQKQTKNEKTTQKTLTKNNKKNGTASIEFPNKSDGFDLATERKRMQKPIAVTLWKLSMEERKPTW